MELPRPIAALVLVFRQLDSINRKRVLTSLPASKMPWLIDEEEYIQLHRSRFFDFCEQMGLNTNGLFCEQIANNCELQSLFRRLSEGRSTFLVPMMYISHILELPIDYFFARDYSYLDLFCVDEDNKISRLTKEERRLVSQYLRMDDAEQNKLATTVFSFFCL